MIGTCEFCEKTSSFSRKDAKGGTHRACTVHMDLLDSAVRALNGWDYVPKLFIPYKRAEGSGEIRFDLPEYEGDIVPPKEVHHSFDGGCEPDCASMKRPGAACDCIVGFMTGSNL